jgi:DNA (cytosine-5)-methyltransferase 1
METEQMTKKILVADLLCGAGGSSHGCKKALEEMGLEMELVCLNHWPTAIKTHEINFPEARHYVQDIATVRPHLIVPEGYLDLLMASPTCTHHSVARGGKPTSDQQRSDPWHIITWLTELRVKRLIIENVWEFISWGPVDHKTGKPIKERKGEYFHAWIETIRRLGYDPEWRKLNAANYGDATTRQRFILMARNDGRKVSWPMPTHKRRDEVNSDLFTDDKPWRPAREIIDWKIKGKSIFNRKKPLAPKTLARIYAGAIKFGWPEPYLVVLRNHMASRGLDLPLPTIAANGNHIALAQPVVISPRHGKDGAGPRPRDVGQPLPTITAGGSQMGVVEAVLVNMKKGSAPSQMGRPLPTITAEASHVAIAEPVLVNMKGQSTATSFDDPAPTITAHAGHLYAAEPIVLSQHSTGAPRSASDPLPTITTGGAGAGERPGCARPMVVTVAHGNDAGEKDPNSRRANSIDRPLGTIHGTGSAYAVVEPFVLSQASCGAPRGVSDPIPTQTTGGNGGSHALISPYYGSGSGETCSSSEDPLPTVTSKGRFGMVVPVTHTSGGNNSRDVEDPIQTITTAKGGEFAVVMPVTHSGGEGRVQGVDAPLQTITGANRGEFAIVDISVSTGEQRLQLDLSGYDILFRMLEPHELAAAMGFIDEDGGYEFAGTKTEQIKQIGNAVSVAKMKACVGAIMSDAAPRRKTKQAPDFLAAAE